MKTMMNFFKKPFVRFAGPSAIRKFRATRWIAIILAVATMNVTQGCYYFKVNTRYKPQSELVSGLDQQQKDFILHFNEKTFGLVDVELDNQTLYGEMKELDSRTYNIKVKPTGPNRYIKKASNNQSYLLNEVHLYAGEYTDLGNQRISVPVSAIEKIEIYDRDTATTVGTWILGGLGVAAAIYLLMAIIVLIFKESCPFVYMYDGESYRFAGEIFSGAIQPGLERFDYLRLNGFKAVGDDYILKVTNEIKEIQHINLAQLKVVDHPEGTEVLMDKYGRVHTISDPAMATTVQTLTGTDISEMVDKVDDIAYPFNATSGTIHTMDGVVLLFDKPADCNQAKLIIRAKNSLWLEHVTAEFHHLFGSKYEKFSKRQSERPPDFLRQMMLNQGLPLSVYIEKDGEWVFSDYYEIAGPMAFRDDVLEINLNGIQGETVRVKLESGFMFWELDYAAIDLTADLPVAVTTVSADEAIDEKGLDISSFIRTDDQLYYVQPEIGNEAILTYNVPEISTVNRTVFLESKGYYHILRDQEGRPDIQMAKSFRTPGRMQQFSKELYERLLARIENREN